MATRRDLLTKAVFGSRIAEEEVDELHSYFVETEDWRKVVAGEVDIIFGSKGAGQSFIHVAILVLHGLHYKPRSSRTRANTVSGGMMPWSLRMTPKDVPCATIRSLTMN